MTHNGRMGLIDRIFKGGGKEKAREPAAGEPRSTQFVESEPDAEDSELSRNAPRRELVQVVLRDTMRKHGIPSDWIECRILSAITRSKRHGLHVNFVVRQAHEQLLSYVFAFQDSFQREIARFEPRSRDWLLSVGWEFPGVSAQEMPDPKSWSQSGRATTPGAPVPAAAPASLATAIAQHAQASQAAHVAKEARDARAADAAQAAEAAEDARTNDEIQSDLRALFAIRDAALADAARKPAGDDDEDAHPEFQATQPFVHEEPKRKR